MFSRIVLTLFEMIDPKRYGDPLYTNGLAKGLRFEEWFEIMANEETRKNYGDPRHTLSHLDVFTKDLSTIKKYLTVAVIYSHEVADDNYLDSPLFRFLAGAYVCTTHEKRFNVIGELVDYLTPEETLDQLDYFDDTLTLIMQVVLEIGLHSTYSMNLNFDLADLIKEKRAGFIEFLLACGLTDHVERIEKLLSNKKGLARTIMRQGQWGAYAPNGIFEDYLMKTYFVKNAELEAPYLKDTYDSLIDQALMKLNSGDTTHRASAVAIAERIETTMQEVYQNVALLEEGADEVTV